MKQMGFIALVAAIAAAGYLVALFLWQRSLLFPVPDRTSDHAGGSAEMVKLVTADGPAMALILRARRVSGPAPLIVFTHGNAELAADWVPVFEEVAEWGVSVLLLEYPGYGGSAGTPSEASITAAADAAYAWAVADEGVDRRRIVAYGRSLGGGAAARLAADHQVAALILESSFTSVADFAGQLLVPRFLVRDPFDSRRALASYRGPLLVIHGTHDTVVPIHHGRELAALVPGARLVEVDCGHNDCPRQWPTIRAFLGAAGVTSSR